MTRKPIPVRNRNVRHVRVRASSIMPNPANWRTHPNEQRHALRALYDEIGHVGSLLAFEDADGRLVYIDGHLRAEELGDSEVDVDVVDLTPAEQAKVLAAYDPLAAMAGVDAQKLDELLQGIDTDSAALQGLLDGLAESSSALLDSDTGLKAVAVQQPPALSWVLLAIPTVRFGEIAALVEQLAQVSGIVLETTCTDAKALEGPDAEDTENG